MNSRVASSVTAACVVASFLVAPPAEAQGKRLDSEWLITPEEASKLAPAKTRGPATPVPGEAGRPVLTSLKANGPILEVQKPASPRIVSPVDILILLRRRNAPVDLKSFRCEIKHRGGFLSKNITEAILPHLTPEAIDWPKAKIPAGKFDLTMSLKDQAGGETVAVAQLDVESN